ncbi:double-strand break repair protein AddB [Aliidongia dinghuensis]|uniref:Double-strand break repair protein AddB n=1 Tax=Aliidongia dinghuensis TaxID=1867774 RepID=A0A8J3E4P2_9PROT|nr:double-strand break repair protein AddB [Aliidongia dinghuensis]GGF28885.1 double-strand break repair protein AddB [Aliidongia dinghuensis]
MEPAPAGIDGARIFTIPATLPFLDALVAGLAERFGPSPLALAEATILLPSRRACRALSDAFLKASGGRPMLLPRLAALGDIDADEIELTAGGALADTLDLPPAIAPLRRRLLLARLIHRWGERRDGSPILPGQAVALADDLARLIDQAWTEEVGFDRLDRLVPAELARHWQITVDFLKIVTEHWPALLADEGAIDPADRRNRLIRAQTAAWRAAPPAGPVIAAGFGSAIPAAAELLGLIATLPHGAVVLPGVETGADADLWLAIGQDPTHPQYGLARLLTHLGVAHDDLPSWPAPGIEPAAPARADLLSEMMRPAAVSDRWRGLGALSSDATRGLARLDCPGPQEEAGTIALLMRHRLETPGSTAMLVTPDRGLARRVAAELKRWDIEIDDSAGVPLNQTPPGVLLRLLADAAAEDLAPVPLLSLLKHPLVSGGMARGSFRAAVRRLERLCLRGPRPAPGLTGLRRIAEDTNEDLAPLVDRLERLLGPFLAEIAAPETTLQAALAAGIATAEALCATDDTAGAAVLWAEEAGDSLANFVAELHEAATGFPPVAGADYPVLLEALLAGGVVRPRFGKHPRLQILGTLEARLQQADLVILGGLNEGVWPPDAVADPWLSRPMRRDFGLEPAEALIGLAAHDFTMAATAGEVVLTRAIRAEGAPTVPSRWLLRLDTVLRAGGGALDTARVLPFLAWQARLDTPDAVRPCAPPAPTPPSHARPRRLSVTEIETWMRDPYAIYARHVLKLRPLDPLDADPGVAERGTFIHEALDRFIRERTPAAEPLTQLVAIGREVFGEALARPGVWAFWWPRFLRIADWFVAAEAERRPAILESFTECRGRLELETAGGRFLVEGKADRIDLLRDGGAALIDYKTGGVPRPEEVQLGYAPQLPLEAAMLQSGGFQPVPARAVTDLAFWRLTGNDPPAEISPAGGKDANPAELARAARLGLERLVTRYDDPSTPYRSLPRPERAGRYRDYDHLARVAEWGSVSGE